MDLGKLKELVNNFAKERDWDQFHSVKNLSMALSVESSELLEIFQWMSEVDSNNLPSDPVKMQQVEEEVADIFVYLLRIASKTNINLEEAVIRKMEKNAKKYPVELARGNSKKYNEF